MTVRLLHRRIGNAEGVRAPGLDTRRGISTATLTDGARKAGLRGGSLDWLVACRRHFIACGGLCVLKIKQGVASGLVNMRIVSVWVM